MPDSHRYSANYGERNSRVLSLEPGHGFSLADSMALASAASSTLVAELEISLPQVPRPRNSPPDFASATACFPSFCNNSASTTPTSRRGDGFEVLEHQAGVPGGGTAHSAPAAAAVRGAERPQSRAVAHLAARSGLPPEPLPTLERGVTASRAEGAWVLGAVHEAGEADGILTAQQINGRLRSGPARRLAPELPQAFRKEIQEDPDQKTQRNGAIVTNTRSATDGACEVRGVLSHSEGRDTFS
jgi:hypothetical protein